MQPEHTYFGGNTVIRAIYYLGARFSGSFPANSSTNSFTGRYTLTLSPLAGGSQRR
jgi:hypothetical protein